VTNKLITAQPLEWEERIGFISHHSISAVLFYLLVEKVTPQTIGLNKTSLLRSNDGRSVTSGREWCAPGQIIWHYINWREIDERSRR
jgi:hypothetical protein